MQSYTYESIYNTKTSSEKGQKAFALRGSQGHWDITLPAAHEQPQELRQL